MGKSQKQFLCNICPPLPILNRLSRSCVVAAACLPLACLLAGQQRYAIAAYRCWMPYRHFIAPPPPGPLPICQLPACSRPSPSICRHLLLPTPPTCRPPSYQWLLPVLPPTCPQLLPTSRSTVLAACPRWMPYAATAPPPPSGLYLPVARLLQSIFSAICCCPSCLPAAHLPIPMAAACFIPHLP
jgi:hypothetical protein